MSAHACCEAGGFRVKAGVRCLVIFCSFVFDGFPRCKLMPSFFFFFCYSSLRILSPLFYALTCFPQSRVVVSVLPLVEVTSVLTPKET